MKDYFWRAWLICGALDMSYAILTTAVQGKSVTAMLAGLPGAAFGDAAGTPGLVSSVLAFVVHFSIMAVMVAVYALIARTQIARRLGPWIMGLLYGLALYGVMYWIVLRLRYPQFDPAASPTKIVLALFPHIVLVGWPMAFLARKFLTPGTATS